MQLGLALYVRYPRKFLVLRIAVKYKMNVLIDQVEYNLLFLFIWKVDKSLLEDF